MYKPPSRYNITVIISRVGGRLPDPISFAMTADQAAWCRSATIASAHTADQIISVVTVHAPGRYAAVAVARAVVSEALKHQIPAPSQHAAEARRGAAAPRMPAA